MHMHATKFGTSCQCGNGFSRVHQLFLVECFSQSMELVQLYIRNWEHIWSIFSTPTPCSPVIVPPASTQQLKYLATKFLGPFAFAPCRRRRTESKGASSRPPRERHSLPKAHIGQTSCLLTVVLCQFRSVESFRPYSSSPVQVSLPLETLPCDHATAVRNRLVLRYRNIVGTMGTH